MLRTLSYFQNTKLNTALEKLFKDLDVPISPSGDAPASVSVFIENNYKSEFSAYTGDAFLLGTVSDDAFEGISTNNTRLQNIRGKKYELVLVFGIEIKRLNTEGGLIMPTRTQLFDLARAFNREFPDQPVVLVFRYCDHFISLAVCERLAYKRSDMQGDKIGKMSLLRDIDVREGKTHSGHLRILQDMTIHRSGKEAVNTFEELYAFWQKKLNVSVLNKRFYEELSNWYFWALHNVQFPNEPLDADEEKLKMHRANNVIRLITRLIFTWFLKEKKLVSDKLFDMGDLTDVVNFPSLTPDEDDNSSIYYTAILQNLFFATLNQEMDKRRFKSDATFQGKNADYDNKNVYRHKKHFKSEQAALDLFKDIPFLNGGLFECLDQPVKQVTIDGFSDKPSEQPHVPNHLFFQKKPLNNDLNEDYGTKNKKYEVRGLINILNDYKFTVAENTPLEEEVALDPELLGRIFENLLASYNPETKTSARKQTGSFYTPREIVNYMVDESLIAYLKNEMLQSHAGTLTLGEHQVSLFGEQTNKKGQFSLETQPNASRWQGKEADFEQSLRLLFDTSETQPFTHPQDVQDLIKAIDTCKILDPACGSGAFPMGILHRMVNLLHKLDPNNNLWKQRQLHNAESIEDSNARDEAIRAIEKAFDKNELDYGRKLYLIENCIYGVDIQPIAVQIAKLRFFISLICDQKVDDALVVSPLGETEGGIGSPTLGGTEGGLNRGVLALPNLETKFVAANTLIGLDNSNLAKMAVEDLMKQREQLRHRIFSAKRYADKKRYREQDERIRQQIKDKLDTLGMGGQTEQLADWNPFDQNASAPFFDADWMFNIKNGFDVVIGNPPYGVSIKGNYRKEILKSLGKVPDFEIYYYFIEIAYKLLKVGGVQSYIIPNTFLFNVYASDYRKNLIDKWGISCIIDCTAFKIFESASVYNAITIFKKEVKNDLIGYKPTENLDTVFDLVNSKTILINKTELLRNNQNWSLVFRLDKKIITLIDQIRSSSQNLSSVYSEMSQGLIAYDKYQGQSKEIIENRVYHHFTNEANKYQKWLWGEDVIRYNVNWNQKEYIDYNGGIANPRQPKYFVGLRILIREITNPSIFATITDEELYHDPSVIVILDSEKYSLKVLLVILNSKFLKFYHFNSSPKASKGGFPKILVDDLRKFPLPKTSSQIDEVISDIVDYLLFQKRTPSVSAAIGQYFEQVIDGMVCELYFTEEMTSKGIDIIGIVSPDLAALPEFDPLSTEAKQAQIEALYRKWTAPASELNNRLSLMTVRSPDVLGVILGGK